MPADDDAPLTREERVAVAALAASIVAELREEEQHDVPTDEAHEEITRVFACGVLATRAV